MSFIYLLEFTKDAQRMKRCFSNHENALVWLKRKGVDNKTLDELKLVSYIESFNFSIFLAPFAIDPRN